MRKTILALLLASCLCGCAVAVVGGGAAATYVWLSGWLKGAVDAPLAETEQAARTVFDELGLVAVEGTVDKLEGNLSAIMASGKKVRVKLKAVDFDTTEVRVRVGTFGDRSISEQIMRHLQRELD